jgi:hypothetical protein
VSRELRSLAFEIAKPGFFIFKSPFANQESVKNSV